MEDPKDNLRKELDRLLREECHRREMFWANYWLNREGRRMVTSGKENPGFEWERPTITPVNTNRLFASFPNLIPKAERVPFIDLIEWRRVIRACIARLKSARAKESTNRNLGALLGVVVKVQHDLETLIGDDWQRQDAEAEKHVTLDDRHSAEAL